MSLGSARVIVVSPHSRLGELARAIGERRGTRPLWRTDLDGILAAIPAHEPAAVVVDVGRCGAIATRDLIDVARRAAVVLVGTGENLPRLARAATADDHLFEHEITTISLERALSHALERRAHRALIHHLLDHDPLTGAPHASAFRARLGVAIDRAPLRPHGRAGVLLVQLDRFDSINESFGYEAGDALLREVAARLTRLVGRQALGRLHAATFAIAYDESTEAAALAREVQRSLEPSFSLYDHDAPLELTARTGAAECPADAESVDALLHAARRALVPAAPERRSSAHVFLAPNAVPA
jgi:diguanylate cyclase (GGDEF)-like protein